MSRNALFQSPCETLSGLRGNDIINLINVNEMMMSFTVGKKFEVIPHGCSGNHTGRIQILLDEGKSFGSGEHETTRTCLEFLELLPSLKSLSVLDVGAGTGILAMAAQKLGARHVIAIDNDPKAVNNARENALLNNLAHNMKIINGEIECLKPATFDLVMANIYDDILIGQAENIAARTAPEGYLILSGICLHRSYDIKKLYSELLHSPPMKLHTGEEYATMLFSR